jgi:transcriptional regulator with XRE-family HTH domain
MELKRRNLGLTQDELGTDPDVRIHQNFISLIELGKGVPAPDQRLRLARRLGLDPDDLLKPADAPQEQAAK